MASKYLCLIKCTFHYFLFVLLKTKPGIAWFVLVWQKKVIDGWVGDMDVGKFAEMLPRNLQKSGRKGKEICTKKNIFCTKKIFFRTKDMGFLCSFQQKAADRILL